MEALIVAFFVFIGCFIAGAFFKFWLRLFGVYDTLEEGRAKVYVLFGSVIGVLKEPGLYFLWKELGPRALLVRWLGKVHTVDMRLTQEYLRSQPVNSEEGAPMGIGIWYEMFVSDPVAFLFRNADPRGSLRANVSNATVRSLSNMKLEDMLESRHGMSRTVRAEVSPTSKDWGYMLGSVYIRKVHFRDLGMIRQIEEKVVNRLRQVTSAIRQDGANQVSVVKSAAERKAAVEFARAAALRPQIVGSALREISADPEVAEALFEVLEQEKLIESGASLTLVPEGGREDILTSMLSAQTAAVPRKVS
ncbi:MAG TPA: SPFH domain-containing protein [Myxococcaceae bacterium]|nr:SPFH domain-containing protein [Myxococcaceae bacterium]